MAGEFSRDLRHNPAAPPGFPSLRTGFPSQASGGFVAARRRHDYAGVLLILSREIHVNLLQFGMIIVTIVLFAIILYQRLSRFEGYLRDLQGIQLLNERLKSLVDGLAALGTKEIEGQLREIQELLDRNLEQGSRNTEFVFPPGAEGGRGPASLVDVVESKLYNLGYKRVSVLTDLSEANASEPIRVSVEAWKDGALHKGSLTLHGTAVIEMDIRSAYTAFP